MGCARSGTSAVGGAPLQCAGTVKDDAPVQPITWATKVGCESGSLNDFKKEKTVWSNPMGSLVLSDHDDDLSPRSRGLSSPERIGTSGLGTESLPASVCSSGFSAGSRYSPPSSPNGTRRKHRNLTFIPETTKEENLLLFDIVVCGQNAPEVIEAACKSASADQLLRRRANGAAADANGCYKAYCQTDKHTVRMHFWSIVKFDDTFPELKGVDFQSVAVLFVPMVGNPAFDLTKQLDELEMRIFEVGARMQRANGARVAMFCMPVTSSGTEVPSESGWRVEIDPWCSKHELELIAGVPAIDDGDLLYGNLTQSVAQQLSRSFSHAATI